MTDAATRWLAQVGIKLLAMDFSYSIEENFSELGRMTAHVRRGLLSRNIPLIEGLAHLDQLSPKGFSSWGCPAGLKGATPGQFGLWPLKGCCKSTREQGA